MAYCYKILIHTLYGRLGRNPHSTIKGVGARDRYDYLTQRQNWIMGDKRCEYYYIVSDISNKVESDWNSPKNAAVQLDAAISQETWFLTSIVVIRDAVQLDTKDLETMIEERTCGQAGENLDPLS